jgi:hypothetical protein
MRQPHEHTKLAFSQNHAMHKRADSRESYRPGVAHASGGLRAAYQSHPALRILIQFVAARIANKIFPPIGIPGKVDDMIIAMEELSKTIGNARDGLGGKHPTHPTRAGPAIQSPGLKSPN